MPSSTNGGLRRAGNEPGARDHPTVERAIDRLAEAAQSVVAGQIEVARLDVKVGGGRMLRSAALLVMGVLMLGGSWTALTFAAYVWLERELPPEQRLGLIALADGVLGMGLLLAGARAMTAHGRD
jgi:hypothetical protein